MRTLRAHAVQAFGASLQLAHLGKDGEGHTQAQVQVNLQPHRQANMQAQALPSSTLLFHAKKMFGDTAVVTGVALTAVPAAVTEAASCVNDDYVLLQYHH